MNLSLIQFYQFCDTIKGFLLRKIDQGKVIQLLLILYFKNVILKVIQYVCTIVKLVKTI